MRTSTFECVVIGAGVMGSSAALQSSRLGRKTLLIEQFGLPHTRGSSHGQTRLTTRIFPDDFICKMIAFSQQEWKDLSMEVGTELVSPRDLIGISQHSETHDMLDAIISSMSRNCTNKYRVLEHTQLEELYPELCYKPETRAVLDQQAGIIMADKCVKAIQEAFRRNGGIIVDRCPVLEVIPGSKVKIKTTVETFIADSLIICAGAWTTRLLSPLDIEPPVTPQKVPVFYWKDTGNALKNSCMDDISSVESFYALPSFEYPGYFKFCYHGGSDTDPDERDKTDVGWIRELCKKYVRIHFPGVEPEPAVEETCMYTVSPDKNPIIDTHPSYKNIVFGCGFSGQGFKLAPACGQIMADLAYGREPKFDIESLKLKRF